MTLYVFDMDGTLTPARLEMTADYVDAFGFFVGNHQFDIKDKLDYLKTVLAKI